MNCVKEEEVGIKMAVSNFVPTINEAAATYKGISAVKEISLQLWLSTVRKKLVQKHFFKVSELSGSSDWGQESPICFLKSVKSQRILSSDIFVFWALHAFEKLTAFIERIRCVVMFEFYNKGQGYCCLHGNSVIWLHPKRSVNWYTTISKWCLVLWYRNHNNYGI